MSNRFFVASFLTALSGSPARGQMPPIQVLEAKPACPTCAVVAEKVTRLSDPASGINGAALNLTVVDRDSRGRYAVADFGSRTSVVLFDSRGKLFKKIGREGDGPGEFRNVGIVFVGKGDTIHAVDRNQARRSLISPDKLEIVGQSPWQSTNFNILRLPNGRILTSGTNQGGTSFGQPFQEMSASGDHARSFGADSKQMHFRWMNPWLARRLVANDSNSFLAIARRNYVIEHWTYAGKMLSRWRTDSKDFPASEPVMEPPEIEKGLAPEVVTAWKDSTGLLYVVSHVRQPEWRRAIQMMKSEGRTTAVITDLSKYWDSVIDVFDLNGRRLLASRRFDQYFEGPAGAGELFIKGDDPDDFIDIWRVRLTRR